MSPRPMVWIAALAALATLGCRGEAPPEGPTLRLWHTFGPEETRALNDALAALGERVEPRVVPFGQARSRLLHTLARDAHAPACPDVARVDATWLPALAARDLLLPVPAALDLDTFTP